jgi:hypothetical protein
VINFRRHGAVLLALVFLATACGSESSDSRVRNTRANAVGTECATPGKITKKGGISYVCARVKSKPTAGAASAKTTTNKGILYGVATIKNWRCARLGANRFQNGIFSVCSGGSNSKARKWALTTPLPGSVVAELQDRQSTTRGALEESGIEVPIGLVLLPSETENSISVTTIGVPSTETVDTSTSVSTDAEALDGSPTSSATNLPESSTTVVAAASTAVPNTTAEPTTTDPIVVRETIVTAAEIGAETTTVAYAPDGSHFVTGFFRGTYDADPGEGTVELKTGATREAAFVTKFDAAGAFVWSRQIPARYLEYGTLVAADGNSGVYVAGRFSGSVDFDPGPGVVSRQSPGSRSGFLLKLNANGDYVSDAIFGGVNGSMHVRSIALAPNGDIALVGYLSGRVDVDPGNGLVEVAAVGNPDGVVVKLNKSGAYQWSYVFGSETEDIDGTWARSVGVSPSGEVYVAGHSDGVVTFATPRGPLRQNMGTAYDGFVLKLTSRGEFEWLSRIFSPWSVYIRAMALDASGNVYVTGRGREALTFVSDAGRNDNNSFTGDKDSFVASLASNGAWRWSRVIGHEGFDEGYAISHSPAGGLLVGVNISGGYQGSLDIGLYQFSSSGDVIGNNAGFATAGPDLVRSIAIAPNGSAIVGGVDGSKQTPRADPQEEEGCVDSSSPGCQALIVRLDVKSPKN